MKTLYEKENCKIELDRYMLYVLRDGKRFINCNLAEAEAPCEVPDYFRRMNKLPVGKSWSDFRYFDGRALTLDKAEIVEAAMLEAKATWNAEIAKAIDAKIVGYKYECGCDCESTYQIEYDMPNDLEWEIRQERHAEDKRISNAIEQLDLMKLGKELGAERIESNLASYGGWHFNAEQTTVLIEKANAIIGEWDKERDNEKAEQDAKFQQARETGKAVELNSWMDDCNDPNEDCSFDNIVLYAMPDGTTKQSRIHCY